VSPAFRQSGAPARSQSRSRACAPHPCRLPRLNWPRQGLSSRDTLPLAIGGTFQALEGTRERCFSPTSATDPMTRAPVNRPIPEHAAFAVIDLHRARLRPCPSADLSALHHAGATRPCDTRSLESMRALTTPIELRVCELTVPRSFSEEDRASLPGDAPTAQVFSTIGRVERKHP
jgi:hypothetical protein